MANTKGTKNPYIKEEKAITCNKVLIDKGEFCGKDAAYKVTLEVRARQGPPITPHNIIMFVCEEHKDITFNEAVPLPAWLKIADNYKRKGYRLNKTFCNIAVEKLKL